MNAIATHETFERACQASEGLSVWDLIDREVMARDDRGERYWTLRRIIEDHGYSIAGTAPLIGCYDEFCDGLQEIVNILERAIGRVRKDWRVRGYSKAAMQHLHKSLPTIGCASIHRLRKAELQIDEIDERLGHSFAQELKREINQS